MSHHLLDSSFLILGCRTAESTEQRFPRTDQVFQVLLCHWPAIKGTCQARKSDTEQVIKLFGFCVVCSMSHTFMSLSSLENDSTLSILEHVNIRYLQLKQKGNLSLCISHNAWTMTKGHKVMFLCLSDIFFKVSFFFKLMQEKLPSSMIWKFCQAIPPFLEVGIPCKTVMVICSMLCC